MPLPCQCSSSCVHVVTLTGVFPAEGGLRHLTAALNAWCWQVTYEDPFTAKSAVEWFNNKEFRGAQRPANARALTLSSGFMTVVTKFF
jgi:hypothetical protein